MHGFLNHITGTLEDIEALKRSDNEPLLRTIKCPRNLGLINSSMPTPKYNQSSSSKLSHSNSGIKLEPVDVLKDKKRSSYDRDRSDERS